MVHLLLFLRPFVSSLQKFIGIGYIKRLHKSLGGGIGKSSDFTFVLRSYTHYTSATLEYIESCKDK